MRLKDCFRFAISLTALAGALPALSGGPANVPSGESLVSFGYEFPSSANVQGQHGAYFMTKMTLYNPNSVQMTINAVLQTPAGLFPPQGASIVLPAKSFMTYENFLQEVFGYTGGAGIGLLDSTLSHNFVAVAEVYVEGPNGRYSTPLTSLFTTDAVAAAGSSSLSVTAGLTATSTTRANFGCASSSPELTTVHVLFNAYTNGVLSTAATDLALPPFSWAQETVPIQGTDILAFFSVTSGGGGSAAPGVPAGIYCYGVNVDNTSNDGTDIVAVLVPPEVD